MEEVVIAGSTTNGAVFPASSYPYYHQIFASGGQSPPTGLLFDTQHFTVMSIAHPPELQTPDLNADKDGDRVLILLEGDLAMQIGDKRFRLCPGDAVQIPRGVRFGKSRSTAGARLLLFRAKPMRSFTMYR